MKKYWPLLVVPFLLAVFFLARSPEPRLILISDDSSAEAVRERDAVMEFLSGQSGFRVSRLSAAEAARNEKAVSGADLVWIHGEGFIALRDREYFPALVSGLRGLLNRGGSLFLSLEAMYLLTDLGLEKKEPEERTVQAVDRGYGRRLGFHSYRRHPVFQGLNGGVYAWNPPQDEDCRLIGYFDENLPQGRVVAVNWAYIQLQEEMKIVLEHEAGPGRVLSVGAYTHLSRENNNRLHLEKFLQNSLLYLAGRLDSGEKHYWEYGPTQVSGIELSLGRVDFGKSCAWNREQSTLSLERSEAGNDFWHSNGRRITVMGYEKSGIDEIWAHPLMIFRDYELGLKIEGDDSIHWLREKTPRVINRPEGFTRVYSLPGLELTEMISAAPEEAAAVAHYEFRGEKGAELLVRLKSNLRFMWPYSERAFRQIRHAWDEQNNSLVVMDNSGDFVSVFGSAAGPGQVLLGRYDDFDCDGETVTGIATEKMQVAALLRYQVEAGADLDFVFAGSSEGLDRAAAVFSAAARDPEKLYLQARDYYENFLREKLLIETPDPVFNDAYKWALLGTDRFFVETPGIGLSLVAGYSTTRTGWAGGHQINGRPGYAWYFGRDGQWSGMAVTGYGDFARIRKVLEVYRDFQDLSGKIYHELTSSGVVHYDASDSTPLYIVLAGQYLRHSGDLDFIRENWPSLKMALDYCFSTDTDGDGLIENTNVGHGWVEGGSLYRTHSEVYLAAVWSRALEEAAWMAGALGLTTEADFYSREANQVRHIINEDFWNLETGFLNFSKQRDGTFNPEKTVLAAVPLYFRQLEKEKGRAAVDFFAGNALSADWGVRILSQFSPHYNPRGYHYGAVWPLFTGWAALAEYAYGNALQGFSHVSNNLNVYRDFSLGYIEEVLHGAEYRPGGVCPHQCWSHTMALQPLYEGMLGFRPDAPAASFVLAPVLPFDWAELTVKNLRIGDARVDLELKKTDGKAGFTFSRRGGAMLEIDFRPAFPPGSKISRVLLNGMETPFSLEEERQHLVLQTGFKLGARDVLEVSLEEGVGILPLLSPAVKNETSAGFRLLETRRTGNQLEVRLEGRPGREYLLEVYAPGRQLQVRGAAIRAVSGPVYHLAVRFDLSTAEFAVHTLNLSY